jgi:hypothetical protein
MTEMSRYLILGAGKFGRLALARLSRQDALACFLVIDRDPEALESLEAFNNLRIEGVQAEAAAFLAQNLSADAPWDWVVPMVPEHVAFSWLQAGPLKGAGWREVVVPQALEAVAAAARRGPQGECYLSRARHRCPDDCPEAGEVCPVSGEAREISLHQELAALAVPEFHLLVIPSQQLAPGVGGYPPRRLLDLVQELAAVEGKVLIATACRCHGVVHGLARPTGEEGV